MTRPVSTVKNPSVVARTPMRVPCNPLPSMIKAMPANRNQMGTIVEYILTNGTLAIGHAGDVNGQPDPLARTASGTEQPAPGGRARLAAHRAGHYSVWERE